MNTTTRATLTFVAGFCDTATFVHMKGVFSAHVTGNFVLFAVSLAKGFTPQDYLKIMTFPFFIGGIFLATLLYARVCERYNKKFGVVALLCWQSLLFTLCSVALLWGHFRTWDDRSVYALEVCVTLCLVIALASQNTIHRFVKVPLSTVMTGTVMNTTAGLTEKYLLKKVIGECKIFCVNVLRMI